MPLDLTLWNVLHDGSLSALEGAVPGDVRMTVEIAYIRERLPDPGDRFVILLSGCKLLAYHDFLKEHVRVVTDLAEIAADEPEILSAKAEGDTVWLFMTHGSSSHAELRMKYDDATILVDSGRVVPLEELVDAAQRYWDDFGQR